MNGAFGFDIFNMRKYGMGLQLCGTDNVLRTAYTDDKNVKSGGGVISSYFLEKGDYFKLDNVTLGYNFNLKNVKLLESVRVYVAAKNLFTITSYDGLTPLINSSVVDSSIGIDDKNSYPPYHTFSLGVSIGF